ncbi:unnamed protein product [Polarella glacialis]|uniref:Uncharacterized protein n=1 Tax=Polarella glacialis TaxID=89957 RepID=A0A813DWS6_POLGL|nr:unnamed protein product [Polarella glacialis]
MAAATGAQAFVSAPSAARSLRSSSSVEGGAVSSRAPAPSAPAQASSPSASPTFFAAAAAGLAAVAATQRPGVERRSGRATCRAAAVPTPTEGAGGRNRWPPGGRKELELGAPTELAEVAAARKEIEAAVKLEKAAKAALPVAIPFLGAPAYRSFVFNVPGDSGFDPAGLAKDLETFTSMREAEIKHARLAMLATVGWPIAELKSKGLAEAWGMRDDLLPNGQVPSVLNGGLFDDAPIPISLGVFFLLAAIIDVKKAPGSQPGFYGFDPLNLKGFRLPFWPFVGALPKGRQWMGDAELKNGRLAMVAITAFAFQEFVTKVPVVQETPYLFYVQNFMPLTS